MALQKQDAAYTAQRREGARVLHEMGLNYKMTPEAARKAANARWEKHRAKQAEAKQLETPTQPIDSDNPYY